MQNIKDILTSASKYEISSVFENDQDATITRHVLIKIEHPQQSAPTQASNAT